MTPVKLGAQRDLATKRPDQGGGSFNPGSLFFDVVIGVIEIEPLEIAKPSVQNLQRIGRGRLTEFASLDQGYLETLGRDFSGNARSHHAAADYGYVKNQG